MSRGGRIMLPHIRRRKSFEKRNNTLAVYECDCVVKRGPVKKSGVEFLILRLGCFEESISFSFFIGI